jgi:hypothetical protein
MGVFVIPCGNGFSCYGFDNCERETKALGEEMGVPFTLFKKDTLKAYRENKRLTEIARQKNATTGWRSQTGLYKPFIGHEGKRVEVTYTNGTKSRFIIGKSTGWIPCHLEIKRKDSHGGGGVCRDLIKSFIFV